MPTVTPLLLEGQYSEQDGKITQTDAYLVQGIRGAPAGRRYFARQTGGIPAKNSPHSVIPGIVARRFTVEPISSANTNEDFKVLVGYEARAIAGQETVERGQTFELSVNTFTEGTIFNKNGNIMKVSYVKFALAKVSVLTQVVNFEIQRPTISLTISETVSTSGRNIIEQDLVGRVNGVPWSGFPRLTWLYRGFNSEQQEERKFRRRHVLTYNPRTWRAEAKISDNGRVPENASLENGIVFFQVYPEMDITAALGLTWAG